MVRQAYVNRLVLGRSAFDPPQSHGEDRRGSNQANQATAPLGSLSHATGIQYAQRYTTRGYPENRQSRDLAKRSRHAQNDILTTIGVCINVDEQGEIKPHTSASIPKSPAGQELARQIIEEHWYGSWIGNISEFSSEVGAMWVSYLRVKIQTFDFYQGIPLSTIIRSEWKHGSKFSFLAAGVLPDTLYHGIKGFVEGVLEYGVAPKVSEWLRKQCLQIGLAPDYWIAVGSSLCQFSFLVLRELAGVALDVIMYLQELGLIASWPPFPRGTLSLLFRLMPSTPARWTRTTTVDFIRAFLLSPIALSLIYHTAREITRELFFRYLRTVLVRPDNPDSSSFQLVLEDDHVDSEEAPVLQLPTMQRTLSQQFRRDWSRVRRTALGITSWAGDALNDIIRQLQPTRQPDATGSTPQNITFAEEPTAESQEESQVNRDNDTTSGQTRSDTSPHSPATSSSDVMSDIDPSAVQVRTRSGSTSTLHMDLEVQLPINTPQVRERRTNSFAQAEGEVSQAEQAPKPPADHHRVTLLTLHPSWTLNVQASGILTSILLLPLESFYLRVLTRQFLASKDTDATWLAGRVYSPARFGLRGSGWKELFAYGGQIMICYGLETALRLYFWRVCGTASLWWGRQMYRWGQL